jgi:2Fe-2S ferredoxin
MSEEKTQGAGTMTEDAPGENTVQVTFLPEGKMVQFEHGKMPYEYHGKEESILDVALNHHITSTTPAAATTLAPPAISG